MSQLIKLEWCIYYNDWDTTTATGQPAKQGLYIYMYIYIYMTCLTSGILNFFDLLIWNKEEKICSNPLARLVVLLAPGCRAVGNGEPFPQYTRGLTVYNIYLDHGAGPNHNDITGHFYAYRLFLPIQSLMALPKWTSLINTSLDCIGGKSTGSDTNHVPLDLSK